MSFSLVIRRQAENHIAEAFDWYEEQRAGLGNEFVLSIEATIRLIENNPLIFQARYKNIRIALAPRFPYGIFYFIDKNKIIVIAVFHLSRNPKLWKKLNA